MVIKDITPHAKTRHGYRVFDNQQIGRRLYHCRYDLIIEGDYIYKVNWSLTVEDVFVVNDQTVRYFITVSWLDNPWLYLLNDVRFKLDGNTVIVPQEGEPFIDHSPGWYISPEYTENPYRYDPWWQQWDYHFQQWQESQKEQRI